MSEFLKYHHVERLGHPEVEGILDGVVHVYPKLDGTNASAWMGLDGEVQAGSRQRLLSLDADNAGFLRWARDHAGLEAFFGEYSHIRLYGEWLVPHTLKTYREDAWRRFWVFDVWNEMTAELEPPEAWGKIFDGYGVDYIDPIAIINMPSEEQLQNILSTTNTFLIQDGAGAGEGIVLKQYQDWQNYQGRQVWSKMVRNAFKEDNRRLFSKGEASEGKKVVEAEIVQDFVTETLVRKELAKICMDRNLEAHRGEIIPRLLGTVFHCVVNEDMWVIVKRFKQPTIDFKRLNRLTTKRVKELVPELF